MGFALLVVEGKGYLLAEAKPKLDPPGAAWYDYDMTQAQWQQLEATVAGMTAEEKHRLISLVSGGALPRDVSPTSIMGAFAGEAELIDQIIEDAYRLRKSQPFRVGE